MRVAIVTESFLPSVNGVARSVQRVVDHLALRGHEALVVAPGDGESRYRHAEVVRLRAVPLPMCRDFPLGVPTRRLTAVLKGFDADVVHLASPVVVGMHAARVARDLGLPTVAVFQTDLAGFATQYRATWAAGPIWRWLGHLHDDVDRTLAPSRSTVAELRRRGFPRVHRWGRGVDLVQFDPAHRTRPPTTAVDTVRVGYIGRLAAEKRVERLATALDLPGVEVQVVGGGSQRRRLERRLPGAHFTGRLDGMALSRAFADLDVFVHTGAHETFCQAVQEALASGVPVVAPAVGGPLDLVQHGANGLLWRPDRPDDIRTAVSELAARPRLRAAMGRTARDGVLHRTWEAVGDDLIRHYLAVQAPRGALRAVPASA
jgi:phosphatidylinositol alpha 1,6-mannosyltransferase